MVYLDALPWAAGIALSSFGSRIGIRINNTMVLPRLVAHFPPDWEPLSSPFVDDLYSIAVSASDDVSNKRLHKLYLGTEEMLATPDLDCLLERVNSDIHHRVALHAKDRLFVHAGVVAWRGKAIVLPGRSHAGKSSLVAALTAAGALYYSDEYAVIDRAGQVHPYPKLLSLREVGGMGSRKYLSAEMLGGQTGTDPVPMGLLVITKYEAGARWAPQTLFPGQALLALLDSTIRIRSIPQVGLEYLGRALSRSTAISSLRGDVGDVIPSILGMVEEL